MLYDDLKYIETFIKTIRKTNPAAVIKLMDNEIHVKGFINLHGLTNIYRLPDNLKIDGDLNISFLNIPFLPSGLEVSGHLNCNCTYCNELPKDWKFKSLEMSSCHLVHLPEGMVVDGSLDLSSNPIRKLPKRLTVKGDLILDYTLIQSLPPDLYVGNTLSLKGSWIKLIPPNLNAKNLNLQETKIKRLPEGFVLEGDLDLSDSRITTLPNKMSVLGNLILDRCDMLTSLPETLKVGAISASGSPVSITGELLKKIRPIVKKTSKYKYADKTSDNIQKELLEEQMFACFKKNDNMQLLSYYKEASSANMLTPLMYLLMGLCYYDEQDYIIANFYAKNIDVANMPKHQELGVIFKLNCLFHLIKNNNKKQYSWSWDLLSDMWIISNYIEFMDIPSKYISHYYRLTEKIEKDLEKNRVLTYTDYELYDVRELLTTE